MGLFVGTVSTQREVLYRDVPLVIAFCAAIIGMYGIGFVLSRVAFRSSRSLAAPIALATSTPDVPSMGPAVLGDLLGSAGAASSDRFSNAPTAPRDGDQRQAPPP
jgi:malonate transporter and related proteins